MTIKNVLRYSLIACAFLLPFIPLIVSGSMFFPYITGKGFAFRILVELMFSAWIVLALLDKEYRPRWSWLLGSLALFVAWMFVADLFSANVFKSFFSNFERMEGWVTLIHLFAYFVVAVSVLNTERLWYWFWHISMGVALIIGIQGMIEIWDYLTLGEGTSRIDATLGNPTYLAVYALFHIFIALMYAVKDNLAWYTRSLYGVFIILEIVTLYYTATRGAILGFIGGITLSALIMGFLSKRKELRYGAFGLIALIILSLGTFYVSRDSAFVQDSPVLKRFASISLTDNTTKSRFMIWNMAWEGFTERPIVGWGQESFNFVFNKNYNPRMYAQEQWFDRVHNIFLDWLIAGGLPGFLLYLSLFVFGMYYLWLYRKEEKIFNSSEKALFTGLFAAYMVHNIFVFDNLISYLFFMSTLAYLHVRVSGSEKRIMEQKEVAPETTLTIVAPAMLVIAVGLVYVLNVTGIKTGRLLIETYKPQEGGVIKNLELYQQAYAYNFIGRQETAEQVVQAASQVVSAESIDAQTKQTFVSGAIKMLQSEIDRSPDDARLQIFMGTFLNTVGQVGEAKTYLEKGLTLTPKKQTLLFELGLASINGGDVKAGVEYMKEAYDLAPEFDRAVIFYAVSLIYDNQLDEAKKLLTNKFGTYIVDDNALLSAYFASRDTASIVEIWKLRAEKNPTDPQMLIGLAAAYMNAGDKKSTLSTLEEVKVTFPDLADQIDSYIKEVKAGK